MNPNINTFNNFQNNNNQEPSFKDKVKAGWEQVPLFVRFVMISTVSLYIMSWMVGVDKLLSNVPEKTIMSLQLWRLFTSVLMTPSIFNILFAFISWIPDAMRLEKTSGTVRYSLNFFTNSFLIQIIYTLSMLLISILFGNGVLRLPSSGLWPLIMAEITMLCLANPNNQVMMFFIPYPFKAIYYPWALFAFFTILNFSLRFDILAGIAYGYLFFFYLRNYIQFSDNFINRCEGNFIFKFFSRSSSFVPLQASNMNSSFNASTGPNYNQNNAGANFRMDAPDKTPVSTPFKGKGIAVGGGATTTTTTTNPNIPNINPPNDNYKVLNNNPNISTNPNEYSVEKLDVSDERINQIPSKTNTNNKYHELQEDV